MSIQAKLIWFNGRIVPWQDATVHVMTHALHYGSSVFEGVRAYETAQGPALFRLWDHIGRLGDSARVQRLPLPYEPEQIAQAAKQVVHDNDFASAYVRILAFRGFGDLTIAGARGAVELVVGAFEWGAYLGEEGLERGVDVCVSSWSRQGSNTTPAAIKSGGNYVSSQLIASEAARNGFAEAIALDPYGNIASGSGENVFLVIKGELYTPAINGSVLPGITRDSVLQLARRRGFQVHEQPLPRAMLYIADEVFFSGTAAELTPVRSIDRLPVGDGERGPVTQVLQRAFFELVQGQTDDVDGWMEPVHAPTVPTGRSGAW